MKKVKYTNRYNDVFTFSKTDDGNILFEGEFKWMRCGWPNVYDQAYMAYSNDVDTDERMTLGEFKKAVHEYDKETYKSTPLAKKYAPLVYSDTTKIDMIDPSGGPYICLGTKVDDKPIVKIVSTDVGFVVEVGEENESI